MAVKSGKGILDIQHYDETYDSLVWWTNLTQKNCVRVEQGANVCLHHHHGSYKTSSNIPQKHDEHLGDNVISKGIDKLCQKQTRRDSQVSLSLENIFSVFQTELQYAIVNIVRKVRKARIKIYTRHTGS